MPTAKTARKPRDKAPDPHTPAELRDVIRATLRHYFPTCEHASLVFIPAPGAPPMALVVDGRVLELARATDQFYSDAGGTDWFVPETD